MKSDTESAWTAADRRRLRALIEAGETAAFASALLKRRESDVVAASIRLGMRFVGGGVQRFAQNAWNKAEIEKLMHLVRVEQRSTKDIAKILNRSVSSVGSARTRFCKSRPKYSFWSAEEDDRLRALWQKGTSVSEIARQMGRTRESIKMRRLKLDVALRTKHWREWTAFEDRTLRQHAALGYPRKVTAATLNRSVDDVRYRRSLLGLVRKRSDVPRPTVGEIADACKKMWLEGGKPTAYRIARELNTYKAMVAAGVAAWYRESKKDSYDMRAGPQEPFCIDRCTHALHSVIAEKISSLRFSLEKVVRERQQQALEVLPTCNDLALRNSLALYILAVFSTLPSNIVAQLRMLIIRWDLARSLLRRECISLLTGDEFYSQVVHGVLQGLTGPTVKVELIKVWATIASRQSLYLDDLPKSEKLELEKFSIAPLVTEKRNARLFERNCREETQRRRKAKTEYAFPHFYEIRFGAQARVNEILRLVSATRKAVGDAREGGGGWPIEFSLTEKVFESINREFERKISFKLYDRAALFRAAIQADSNRGGERVKAYENGDFFRDPGRHYLEIVSVERPDGMVGVMPWYMDFVKFGIFSSCTRGSLLDKERQRFNEKWGYPTMYTWQPIAGLQLYGRGETSDVLALRKVGTYLFDPVVILARCLFGNLIVQMATRTGARLGEILQIAATERCIHSLEGVGPKKASRWVLSLIPKGRNTPEDYFIDENVKATLMELVKFLFEELHVSQLPEVRGSKKETLKDRYVFQYAGRRLDLCSSTSCLKFLLHDLVRAENGRVLDVSTHIFRHNFATEMKRLGAADEVVRELLHQRDLKITGYYSKPTREMVRESVEAIFINRVDITKALRSPHEIARILEEGQGKIGALSEVIGGTCVVPNMCSAKWVCVGCSGNAPDPRKRSQVEQKRKWAQEQSEWAKQLGLNGEIRQLEKTISDCDRMLEEMSLIEASQRDGCQVVQPLYVRPE